jgi:hypothetical protein
MDGEQVMDHVIGMVEHFKRKMEDDQLSGGEAAVYLRCLAVLGVRDTALTTRNMERLSNAQEALELPFKERD